MKQFRFLMIIILLLGLNSWVVGPEIKITTKNPFSTSPIAYPEDLAQKITNIQTGTASSLVLEAGNKYHIELWYDNSEHYGPTEEAVALLLQDQLDATGFFDVELKSTTWGDYVSQLNRMPTSLLGWWYDFPDESNYIDPFVGSGAFSLGTNYSSPIMDSYIQTMVESSDAALRQTAIRNALQLMAEDIPLVPLFTMNDEFIAYGSDISGVVLEPSGTVHFASINKAGRTDIVLGTTDSIQDLDPANVYSWFASNTLMQISHGLFELPTNGMSAEPVLVDSYSISGDGLTYTFNLTSGVTFTDGSSVTVGDVIWSLNRSASLPGDPSFLLSGIDTSSFTAINSTAFSLQLTGKDGTFLDRLTYTNAWIFKEDPTVTDTLQGSGYIPIGIGPYEIISWTPGVEMVLNASDHYTPTAIGTVAPVNDNITIQFFPSSANLKTAIEGGTIDVAFRSFNPDEVKALEANPTLKTDSIASLGIRYLIINVEAHPNKNIRQAISYAIDRERFTNIIFEDKNQALYSMVPPGFDTACNKGDPCAFPNQDLDMVKTLMESEGYSAGVTPHDPILVTSNDEFLSQNFTGLGTIEVPYRFEGHNITSSSGNLIEIRDTTAYFVIGKNLLNGMSTDGRGIDLQNVQHGTIVNNTISNCNSFVISISVGSKVNTIANNTVYNNNQGVYLYDTSNNTITGNWAFNNNGDGFHIGGSSNNNSIFNNTVNDNEDGIVLESSSDNTISSNIIHNNDYCGISFLDYGSGGSHNNTITYNRIYGHQNSGIDIQASNFNIIDNNAVYNNNGFGINLGDPNPSHNNKIRNNTVYNSGWAGIALISSDNNTVEKNYVYNNNNGINIGDSNNNAITMNLVYNNGPRGIIVTDSKENKFLNNVIFNNVEWGISFESSSDNNMVQFNDFYGNNGGNQQASDQAINNVFSHNHWSDWTGTGSYAIDGSAENQDKSPLTNPYHLSAPVITAPTSVTPTLKDSVTIQWTASSDLFGHSITYAVLYSTDNGIKWIALASGLTTTSYTWDLTTIYDGTTIRLKVQTTDNLGFTSFSVSPTTFTIKNPSLTSTTTTPTTATTPTTTISTPSVDIPGWNVLVLLLSLFVMLSLRQRKKKP